MTLILRARPRAFWRYPLPLSVSRCSCIVEAERRKCLAISRSDGATLFFLIIFFTKSLICFWRDVSIQLLYQNDPSKTRAVIHRLIFENISVNILRLRNFYE